MNSRLLPFLHSFFRILLRINSNREFFMSRNRTSFLNSALIPILHSADTTSISQEAWVAQPRSAWPVLAFQRRRVHCAGQYCAHWALGGFGCSSHVVAWSILVLLSIRASLAPWTRRVRSGTSDHLATNLQQSRLGGILNTFRNPSKAMGGFLAQPLRPSCTIDQLRFHMTSHSQSSVP